jgi:hypothetical protein
LRDFSLILNIFSCGHGKEMQIEKEGGRKKERERESFYKIAKILGNRFAYYLIYIVLILDLAVCVL